MQDLDNLAVVDAMIDAMADAMHRSPPPGSMPITAALIGATGPARPDRRTDCRHLIP